MRWRGGEVRWRATPNGPLFSEELIELVLFNTHQVRVHRDAICLELDTVPEGEDEGEDEGESEGGS